MYKVLALFLYFCGEIFIGMTITELQQLYAAHPNMAVMKRLLKDTSVQTIFCGGLYASAASLFSSILVPVRREVVLLSLFWAIWRKRGIFITT